MQKQNDLIERNKIKDNMNANVIWLPFVSVSPTLDSDAGLRCAN